jgi:subtilisin family serine protease
MRVGLFLFFTLLIAPIIASADQASISDQLFHLIESATQDEQIPVIVLLHPRYEVSEFTPLVADLSRDERKRVLWNEISNRSTEAQSNLHEFLREAEQRGHASRITPLMIGNGIGVHATKAVLLEVATFSETYQIFHAPEEYLLPEPQNFDPHPPGELDEIAWNVDQVNAPAVWDEGCTGEGVLVAVLDSGIRYTHLDLADHLWDGGPDYPNHGWDFYNNDNDPYETINGHGTHTSGNVCGDGTAGFETGVAPDATLMCVQVLNTEGWGSLPVMYAGLDFCLEQGVDVTSSSLGWGMPAAPVRATFRIYLDQLNLAGIVSIVAAGNEAGGINVPPGNIRTPGDVPPPFIHPDQLLIGETSGVITVGATDIDDLITDFSSRGPTQWGDVHPFYDWPFGLNDVGLFKPEISAPGLDVLSLGVASNTSYAFGWGTSMATPHVAGAACLLLSADSNLTTSEVAEALMMSSLDLGSPGMDNAYGAGRLDCLAAFDYINGGEVVRVELVPLYDPFIIPANGGTLEFDAIIGNRLEAPASGDAWVGVSTINGPYLLDTYRINLQPGIDFVVNNVTQFVPAGVPGGTYEFIVRLGSFPNTVVAEDSFTFIKVGQVGHAPITVLREEQNALRWHTILQD